MFRKKPPPTPESPEEEKARIVRRLLEIAEEREELCIRLAELKREEE